MARTYAIRKDLGGGRKWLQIFKPVVDQNGDLVSYEYVQDRDGTRTRMQATWDDDSNGYVVKVGGSVLGTHYQGLINTNGSDFLDKDSGFDFNSFLMDQMS